MTSGILEQAADTIFFGGDIITMDAGNPDAEAVAVKDGKILTVGARRAIERAHKGKTTRMVDMAGRTLVPGFIDAHSHFIFALQVVNWANVSIKPVGPVESIADIIQVLKNFKKKVKPAKDAWIIAYGYDGSGLKDGRDVTRDDLDPLFPSNPVMLLHVSGHGAVLNSAAFRAVKFDMNMPTPPGGVIARKPGTNEPAGLLMETAYAPIFSNMPQPSEEELLEAFGPAQNEYAQNGMTTINEGATQFHDLQLLRKAAGQDRLFLDVIALPFYIDAQKVVSQPGYEFGIYRKHLKLGAIKIVCDGSPQGKTAYMTKPYLTGGPTGEKDWRGEPSMPYEEYYSVFKLALDHGIRVFTHANGDAAIDMVIRAHEQYGVNKADDQRNVVIHSQFMRPDQLDRYTELGIVPSFFTSHAFFWGDLHVKNLGEERASFLSPMKTAYDKGIRYANHTDFNVTPLDPMMMIWSAVTRLSRSGKVIGPEQRVTPLQALKAITLDAAYQYGEETLKGSIEPGKLADLVILSENPLKVDPAKIRDIRVLETIKEGKTIYTTLAEKRAIVQI